MFKKFTRFSYYFMKELVEQHNSLAYKCTFSLDLLLFVYSFRYLETAFFLYKENSSTYPKLFEAICANDAVCFFYHQRRFKYDAFIPVGIFLMESFNVYCQLKLVVRLDVSKATWQWWHQLIVLNQEAYYRAQLTELFLDHLFALWQGALVLVIILYYGFFSPPMLLPFEGSRYYRLTFTFLSLEFVIFGYCLLQMVSSAVFFAYCSLLGTVVYVGHLLEINAQVKRTLTFDGIQLKTTQRRLFRQFLRDHNLICFFVLQGSKDLFGGVLYAFLMTNIPIHIYGIRRWFFIRQDAIDHLFTAAILFSQTVALIIVLLPLALCHKVFHLPKKWMNNFQLKSSGKLSKPWLRLKLKYDDLFHRLSYGPKMAVNMGPISPVTIGAVLEFTLIYFGYILMAFKQMIQRNGKLVES
ncbi:hypothetical protein TYRP_003606 [Tyrophagus putrescentiae]|nr:hypothetical protein TYRP_003606 [Tyrophagus putrescentiae]